MDNSEEKEEEEESKDNVTLVSNQMGSQKDMTFLIEMGVNSRVQPESLNFMARQMCQSVSIMMDQSFFKLLRLTS